MRAIIADAGEALEDFGGLQRKVRRSMAETGVALLAGPMRPITDGYPATVKAWGTQGANLFNNGVMTDGVDAACDEAKRDVIKARAIIARDR
jgi:hypothetical protein